MDLHVCNLGEIEYREGVALQERVRTRVQEGELPGVLLLLEHPPVYTRGRRSEPGELTMGEAWYAAQGIDVVQTDRGGKLTYHGPGQLVGYPILPVTDVVAYLRTMEEAIVAALAEDALDVHPARVRAGSGDVDPLAHTAEGIARASSRSGVTRRCRNPNAWQNASAIRRRKQAR